jgi:hypothetical protein
MTKLIKNQKLDWLGLIILIVSAVLAGIFIWTQANQSIEQTAEQKIRAQVQQAQKEYEEMLKLQREDTYGGDTPEQTWQMFLDALKAEDLDLAAKYFVVGKQEEWRQNLYQIKEAGELENMIKDLTAGEMEKISLMGNRAEYLVGPGEEITAHVVLYRNPNNKWKISSL